MESYILGNWTVSAQTTDTVTTAKTLSIPDLSYATDYARQKFDDEAATVVNTTGKAVGTPESIRYACSAVADVYSGLKTDKVNKFESTKGMQIMSEIRTSYRGTNKVTGQEIDIPTIGRIVLRIPSFACVTDAMVQDVLNRTVASILATGKTDASRIAELLRGSLLPDNL